MPIATGNANEALLALVNGKFVKLRVPYPMGFYTKWMDGRIDDPTRRLEGQGAMGDLQHAHAVPRRGRQGHDEQGREVPASTRPARAVSGRAPARMGPAPDKRYRLVLTSASVSPRLTGSKSPPGGSSDATSHDPNPSRPHARPWRPAPALGADLKLGFTLSLTGGTDDYGKGARMGAELALEGIQRQGRLHRARRSKPVIYDDETKPAKGVENVTRLITRDKVFAIVGPVNSGVALAIIDIAQKKEVPLMDTIATAEQIIERYANAPKNYIFRVSLNDGIQTSFMIDYIQKKSVISGSA